MVRHDEPCSINLRMVFHEPTQVETMTALADNSWTGDGHP
jgi:hypothetical protein